jgi:hypothetical protein
MNIIFISAASRWRSRVRKAQNAYREAIRQNLEFSETKKLYQEFKLIEKEFERITKKKTYEEPRMSFY